MGINKSNNWGGNHVKQKIYLGLCQVRLYIEKAKKKQKIEGKRPLIKSTTQIDDNIHKAMPQLPTVQDY